MASKLLYHVTPTSNLDSIRAKGLIPKAGQWSGPMTYAKEDINRISDLLRHVRPTVTYDGEGRGSIEMKGKEDTVRTLARLGPFHDPTFPVLEWPPSIFLCTSLMAAYWIAHEFSLDRHHGEQPFSILTLTRDAVPSELRPDPYIPIIGGKDRLARKWRKRRGTAVIRTPYSPSQVTLGESAARRQRLGSVMTETTIPPDAIASHGPIPDNLMAIAEFRRWMGLMTYQKSKWKWRLRR